MLYVLSSNVAFVCVRISFLKYLLAAAVLLTFVFAVAVYVYPVIVEATLLRDYVHSQDFRDSVKVALELGRLDLISILLAVIAVVITLLSFVGFGYVSRRADEVAKKTANEVAKKTANEVAKETANKIAKEAANEKLDELVKKGLSGDVFRLVRHDSDRLQARSEDRFSPGREEIEDEKEDKDR